LLLLLPAALALAVPPPDAAWAPLHDGPVTIVCVTAADGPWCRASATVTAPPATLAELLASYDRHTEVFHSVSELVELAPGLLHIVLDYPSPLADRDYVASFTRVDEADHTVFRWQAATHPSAPPVDGRVRLEHTAGEWRLSPAGAHTQVEYVWQADIGASMPAWIQARARKMTGEMVLGDLAKGAGASLLP
jgi:hypothetical protein